MEPGGRVLARCAVLQGASRCTQSLSSALPPCPSPAVLPRKEEAGVVPIPAWPRCVTGHGDLTQLCLRLPWAPCTPRESRQAWLGLQLCQTQGAPWPAWPFMGIFLPGSEQREPVGVPTCPGGTAPGEGAQGVPRGRGTLGQTLPVRLTQLSSRVTVCGGRLDSADRHTPGHGQGTSKASRAQAAGSSDQGLPIPRADGQAVCSGGAGRP